MNEIVEKFSSVHLQNERSIWIREPAAPAKASRLTIFLDAELYRDRVGANTVIDDLHATVADSWYVFVSAGTSDDRWRECPCHPPFAKFIAEELLPWLESRFTNPGLVRQRILVGLSYTGLAAAFVAREYLGVFQKVVCQSGSFWWNDCWLVDHFERVAHGPRTEFYLDVGAREMKENVRHREDVLQVVSQIEGVRRFRDLLLRRGYSVKYLEFDGGHEFEAWKKTLPGALGWALARQAHEPRPK